MKNWSIFPIIVRMAVLSTIVCPLFSQGIYVDPGKFSREELLRKADRAFVVLEKRRVLVDIMEAGVTVEVTETFRNTSNRVLEGTYVFPLPRGAVATGLTLFINGEEVSGEVLDSSKAKGIYSEIVRKSRDPGLLEYIGQGLLRASIFPIQARSQVTIKIKYVSTIEKSGALYRFSFPLKTSAVGNAQTIVNAHIVSKLPVRNVYSPSHDVDIARLSDYDVRVFCEDLGKGERSFNLYYTLSGGDLGFSLMTHTDPMGDKYFMFMASPKIEVENSRVLPKDVILVIDKSGSMQGEKWLQAREALKFCIRGLNGEDRFDIVSFSTDVMPFKERLVRADEEEKNVAEKYLDTINPTGGTNINDALMRALELTEDSSRLCMVALLTDGLPTVGVVDPEAVIKNVRRVNKKRLRIFNFGVGYDVNTYLLDRLARSTRGATEYIEPREDIEVKVSDFFSKISDPVLSDVQLAFEGIKTFDVYPKEPGDLFARSCLMATGRFEDEGKATIALIGRMGEEKKRYTFTCDFTSNEGEYDFLPVYWAMRKTGYLLDAIRLNGYSDEVKAEIVNLGRRYGLVTPYTSALVIEESARLARATEGGADRDANIPSHPQSDSPSIRRGIGNVSGQSGYPTGRGREAHQTVRGDSAVERQLKSLSEKAPADSRPGGLPAPNTAGPNTAGPGAPGGSGVFIGTFGPRFASSVGVTKRRVRNAKAVQSISIQGRPTMRPGLRGQRSMLQNDGIVHVNGLTFHKIDDLFVDSRFKEEDRKNLIRIEAFSSAYFSILNEVPTLQKILALGDHLIFIHGDKVYEIYPVDETEEKEEQR